MRTFEDNRVVRHTGSKYPIFQAPIGGMSRSQWAGAVSAAGGMGLIATAMGPFINDTKDLDNESELVRQKDQSPVWLSPSSRPAWSGAREGGCDPRLGGEKPGPVPGDRI